jgi:hypothetical protein
MKTPVEWYKNATQERLKNIKREARRIQQGKLRMIQSMFYEEQIERGGPGSRPDSM